MATKLPESNQALIFGASGVSGWALMRECLVYPTTTTYSRVIGLTNRPLSKEAAIVPDDARLEIHSGMDLTSRDTITERLGSISGIENVSHVYFTAYTGHGSDYQELRRANVEILENALHAVDKVCPQVRFWVLQTGGKYYGVEFYGKVPYNPPHKESAPRIPKPWADNIFYYPQIDLIDEFSKGKDWTYCELRPDAIIGSVPQGNAMNLAQCLGLYLSLYASINGKGATVPFPSSPKAYRATHTDVSQDIVARMHIFTSLHPEAAAKRAFNVADGDPVTWADVWPGICAYFGLKGGSPTEGEGQQTGTEWVKQQRDRWTAWEQEKGMRKGTLESTTWTFMDMILGIEFNREFDLSSCRQLGFKETKDHVESYLNSFDRMREAGAIPKA